VIEQTISPNHYIRQWRKHRGLTQADLACAIGVDRTYLNKIERGKRDYVPHVLEAAAVQLGCAPGDLVSRHPARHTEIETFCMSLSDADRQRALAVLKTVFSL